MSLVPSSNTILLVYICDDGYDFLTRFINDITSLFQEDRVSAKVLILILQISYSLTLRFFFVIFVFLTYLFYLSLERRVLDAHRDILFQ